MPPRRFLFWSPLLAICAVLCFGGLAPLQRAGAANVPAVTLSPASGPPGTRVTAIGTFGAETGLMPGCDVFQVRWEWRTVVATAAVQPTGPAGTAAEAAFHVSFVAPPSQPGTFVVAFTPIPAGSAEPDAEQCPGVEATFTVSGDAPSPTATTIRPRTITVSVDRGEGGGYFIGEQVGICVIWDDTGVSPDNVAAFLITPLSVRVTETGSGAVMFNSTAAPRAQRCFTHTATFPIGQRTIQADLAPEGAGAAATATTRFSVSTNAATSPVRMLGRGCSNVTPSVTESVTAFTARISPQGALISMWEFRGNDRAFAGWFALPGAPADLTTVTRLKPVYVCLRGPATLMQPPA
jgi:hypothetical protein